MQSIQTADTIQRVYGTSNFRVCNACIIPINIGTHLHAQSTVYAIAEQETRTILYQKQRYLIRVLSFFPLYQTGDHSVEATCCKPPTCSLWNVLQCVMLRLFRKTLSQRTLRISNHQLYSQGHHTRHVLLSKSGTLVGFLQRKTIDGLSTSYESLERFLRIIPVPEVHQCANAGRRRASGIVVSISGAHLCLGVGSPRAIGAG